MNYWNESSSVIANAWSSFFNCCARKPKPVTVDAIVVQQDLKKVAIAPTVLPQKKIQPLPKIYNQDLLIKQLNRYLSKLNALPAVTKPFNLIDEGVCQGLTMLWLYKIATGEVEWFYQLIKRIIDWSGEDVNVIAEDVMLFYPALSKAQNPGLKLPDALQRQAEKVLEIERIGDKDKKYSNSELRWFLEKHLENGAMVCIADKKTIADKEANHAIGLYFKKNVFYLYDANFPEGTARYAYSFKELMHLIRKSLGNKDFKNRISLEIDVFSLPEPKVTQNHRGFKLR